MMPFAATEPGCGTYARIGWLMSPSEWLESGNPGCFLIKQRCLHPGNHDLENMIICSRVGDSSESRATGLYFANEGTSKNPVAVDGFRPSVFQFPDECLNLSDAGPGWTLD